jgi:5'-3' exonuclease
MATFAHNMEADDLMRMWHHEATLAGEHTIVCSIDKDLKCMAGRHYLMHKNEFLDVTPDFALRFYYEQLLKGDPTDNIKGIPKVGDVKAKAYLAEANTEAEFQVVVQKEYQNAFGEENWKKELILNGNLIYLKKTMDDEFSIDGWPDVPYVEPVVVEKPAKGVKKVTIKAVRPDFTVGVLTDNTSGIYIPAPPIAMVGTPPSVGDDWGKKEDTTNAT